MKKGKQMEAVYEKIANGPNAAQKVLKAVFEMGPATSPEMAEMVGLPVASVSSTLSKLYKRIPDVLKKATSKRPYRWMTHSNSPVLSSDEAYDMYLVGGSQEELPESSVPMGEPSMGELVAGGPSEVTVTITGRIEIAVGWVGKL